MHVHAPKPPHSWSDLAREVGVIVVGILLALGAEQIVERLHWREQVEIAENGIKGEVGDSAINAYERLIVQPCLQGQIKLLARQLDAPGEAWSALPASGDQRHLVMPAIYAPPSRLFAHDFWQNATASGIIAHLPAARIASYSRLYDESAYFQELQKLEASAASRLTILGRDRTLSRAERNDLLGTLAEVDRINGLMVLIAEQMLGALRDAHLHYDKAEVELGRRDVLQHDRAFRGACVADLPLDLG